MTGYVRIGLAADVPLLEGRKVTLGGRQIAVFRLEDGWGAIDHVCPHAGGPLADGIVAGGCVTCPLHALRFDVRTGEGAGGGPSVAAHEVLERDGELWLKAGAARAVPAAA